MICSNLKHLSHHFIANNRDDGLSIFSKIRYTLENK
jgi:hypothetical protein